MLGQLEYFLRISGGANSKNNHETSSSSSASLPFTKQYFEPPVEERSSIYLRVFGRLGILDGEIKRRYRRAN